MGVVSEDMFVDEEIDRFGEEEGPGPGHTPDEASAQPSPCRQTRGEEGAHHVLVHSIAEALCMCVWLFEKEGEEGGAWASEQRGKRPGAGHAAAPLALPCCHPNNFAAPPLSHTTVCPHSACHNGGVAGVKAVVWHTREGPRRRSLVNFSYEAKRANRRERGVMPY